MQKSNSDKQAILLHVHEIRHQLALANRNTIFNAFSLTFTGLLVLAAAVVSREYASRDSKYLLLGVTFFVFLVMIGFIRDQRIRSEKYMDTVRQIDEELGLFDKGRILSDKCKSVLSEDDRKRQKLLWGLSWRVDVPLVIALAILSLGVIVAILLLPSSPTCP